MGIRNSSLTRVKPLFDQIMNNPNEIDKFLLMMSGYKAIDVDYSECKILYGQNEKHLPPPISLLEWQIENLGRLSIPQNYGVSKSSPSYSKRKQLFKGNIKVLEKARFMLGRCKIPARAWYIFEGYTVPDIYIETKNHIFVGEAKRTENKLTTNTTWLGERDQLVRHVDAILDSKKKVFSFFLFSKIGFESRFSKCMNNYTCIDYLRRSLPHRTNEEIEKLSKTFIGYSFWEDLGEVFSVEYPEIIQTL